MTGTIDIQAIRLPQQIGLQVSCKSGAFVVAKHVESGIAVTKFHNRFAQSALDEAMIELEELVNMWEGM
jgi:hypothetical protein